MAEPLAKGPQIGQRHILVLCSGVGLAVLFSTRLSLPVALVSMISSNVSRSHHLESNDSCPTPSSEEASPLFGETPSHHQFSWGSQIRGLILSSFFWGYLALQIPSGGLAQRYGAKWLMAASITWLSLVAFLTPTMAELSPYALIALLALEGVGSSIALPSLYAMFGRWIPPEENSGLVTIALSGIYIGTIFGQFVSGVLCKFTLLGGWPLVFYVNGALGVMFVFSWTVLIANSPEDHPRITDEEKNYIISSLNSKQSEANKRGVPWCRILCSRSLIVYNVSSFVFGWILYSFTICFAQYFSEILHQNVAATGALLCLPIVAEIVMANVFTQLVDILRRRQWLSLTAIRKIFTFIGFGGTAVCLFGVTLVKCNIIQIELLFAFGFAFYAANYAGYMNIPLDNYPEYSGTVCGIGNVFLNLPGLISPIVINKMTSDGTRSSWNNVLYVTSTMAAFAAILYILLGNSDRMKFDIKSVTEDADDEEALLGKRHCCGVAWHKVNLWYRTTKMSLPNMS